MSFLRLLTTSVAILLAACSEPGQTEIARGNVLASQKKFSEAVAAYRAAAAALPRKAHPRELLGHLLFDMGQPAEARAAYELALKAEPDNALEARIGLARLDAEELKLDNALERLNRILEKHPESLYALLSRATVALRRGRSGDAEIAIADTAKAIALDSHNPAVLYTRGCAFIAAKQPDEAQKTFALLEQAHPKSPLGYYGSARLASARGDRLAALGNLRQSRAKAHDLPGGWNPGEVRADPAFESLKGDPQFAQIVDSP